MLQKSTKKKTLCSICGKQDATTRDHIPPKGIFSKPRPNDLITVPSCIICNQGSSEYDEKFRLYLGLHVGKNGITGNRFFQEEVLRTVRHNRKLRNEVINKLKPVYITTNSGIIFDKGYSAVWDSEAHDAIIERTLRGLFYHHYGYILGDNASVRTHWFKELPGLDYETFNKVDIGDGIFSYYYNKAIDCEYESIWVFEFYKSHWAGGYSTKLSVKGV